MHYCNMLPSSSAIECNSSVLCNIIYYFIPGTYLGRYLLLFIGVVVAASSIPVCHMDTRVLNIPVACYRGIIMRVCRVGTGMAILEYTRVRTRVRTRVLSIWPYLNLA